MNEIIPLVSYPKSGNTWMRFILSNLFKKNESFDVNFKTINDISSTSHSEDHTKMLSLLKPGAPLFIKEHCNYYNMSYKTFDKAIYIYRNGFDTLLSYWHFKNAQSPGLYKNIENFSECYWGDFGHWGDNLFSWLQDTQTNKSHNVYPISYEYLMKEPVNAVKNCMEFLQYDISEGEIQKAIDLSSKEKMKEMDGSAAFMKSKVKDFHFVRSGEVKKELPQTCQKEFISYQMNYDMMVKYKYLTEQNDWFHLAKTNKIPLNKILKNKIHNHTFRFFNK